MPSADLGPENVWELDLPPLADVQGKARLDRSRLPESLADIPERIFRGVDEGKRLFVLLRQQPKTPERPFSAMGGFRTEEPIRFEAQADLFQMVHRGLARDERLTGFVMWSPDDRDPKVKENASAQYERLSAAARAIEEKSGHDAGEAFLRWTQEDRKLPQEPKGAVIVLTPEIAELLGKDKALYLFSKLKRLFPAENVEVIEVPAAQENLYTGWERHIERARVDECRRLLQAAIACPVQKKGMLERASRFPNTLETQPAQEPAVQAILRQLQRLMMSPAHLLLTGERGLGKTTLVAGAYQLARQLGFGAHYTCWSADQAKLLGKELIEHNFLVDRDKPKDPAEDRFLAVDQVDMGVDQGDNALDLYQLGRAKLETISALKAVLEARQKRLAARTRMVMTSNLPVDEIRKRVQRSLADHANFYDSERSSYRSDQNYSRSVCTLGYVLGEPVLSDTLQEGKSASPQPPTTYATFINHLHVVPLGGQDWGTIKTGGVEWQL